MMGASMLLLIYLIFKSKKSGEDAGRDPWDAFTLEWATTSPSELKNFDELPVVHGRRPLWDWKQNPKPPTPKGE